MTKITRNIFALLLLGCTQFVLAQGFSASPLQWNIPGLGNDEYKVYDSDHSVIDFNGDGKPDLVDSSDGGNVFTTGSQKYWKVYLNTGSAFSQAPIQWNIPNLGNDEYIIYDSDHGVYDFNGDDKPDLVDSSDGGNVFMNGGQRYWKVYLNTGSGFSPTFVQWNLPVIGSDDYKIASTTHNVIDFNGDNKPDLIDSSDSGNVFTTGTQKYWKVYLNTGSGFNPTFVQWNIPAIGPDDYKVSATTHNTIDFNGDNKPDMIDSSDNGNVFTAGGQKYWKVYLNTGSGFSASFTQWNIPVIGSDDYKVSDAAHNEIDFNGDNKPDLIDSSDNGSVFTNGSQRYWKVYLNSGTGFSPTALQWNIPNLESYDYAIYHTSHSVIDFNNDNKPDLVDSGDSGNVFTSGSQMFWKVYLNNGSTLSAEEYSTGSPFRLYPNPVGGTLHVTSDGNIRLVSIYNLQGQNVAKVAVNGAQAALDVSHLPRGIYFARVFGRNAEVSVEKFVRE